METTTGKTTGSGSPTGTSSEKDLEKGWRSGLVTVMNSGSCSDWEKEKETEN